MLHSWMVLGTGIMSRPGIASIIHHHYWYNRTRQSQALVLLIFPKQVLHSLDFVSERLLLIGPGEVDGISALHDHWQRSRFFDVHLEPTRMSVCILTIPLSCNMTCAWPMSRITSSHDPSECLISNHPQHNDNNVTILMPALSATSLPAENNMKCKWNAGRCLTNSRPSRVHRVAQPTLLHQALHVGDLFRDGSSRCTDLIHHESRMQLPRLVQCQSTQLTYRNETEVCNACLWRPERSWWLSHNELQCAKWRQFRSALPLDL